MEWQQAISACYTQGEPWVLVTIVQTGGSTPRELGTKMLVTHQKSFGTIGGGKFEFSAIEKARSLLMSKQTKLLFEESALGASFGQCCGGRVTLLYEPYIPFQQQLYLFGNGFVAQEIVKICCDLPIKIIWVDARANNFPANLSAQVRIEQVQDYLEPVEQITPQDCVLVMTHSHTIDFDIVHAVFRQGVPEYFGTIGSLKKRANFEKKLRNTSIPESILTKWRCPIGQSLTNKSPKAIAISVVAEILQVQAKKN